MLIVKTERIVKEGKGFRRNVGGDLTAREFRHSQDKGRMGANTPVSPLPSVGFAAKHLRKLRLDSSRDRGISSLSFNLGDSRVRLLRP